MSATIAGLDLPAGAILPGSPLYETRRRVWNGSIDRHPLAIVPCRSAADVAATVRAAVAARVPLAVRGGGHSLPGFSTCDGGLVVDLSPMAEVLVDPDERTANVGGGATWGAVDAATQRFGLATTGGLVSTTGVGGLTLGGGIGWLTRQCGLACDNLLGAEVVTASGELIQAGPTGDPELLWGLRGGGGNFGVVTRFEFRLHEIGPVRGGVAMFRADRALQVYRFYRDWLPGIPDELTPMLIFLVGPDDEAIPRELRGQVVIAIAVCHAAPAEKADADLRPILDLGPDLWAIEPMPYAALQQMFDADVPAGDRYYFKGGFLAGYPDEMLDVLLAHMSDRPGPRCEVDLHHMGGAAARVGEDDTAFPGRAAVSTSNVYACWTDPSRDAAHRSWARGLASELERFAGPGAYVNFLSEPDRDRLAAVYGDSRLARLRALKRRYDPANLFRLNQNIQP